MTKALEKKCISRGILFVKDEPKQRNTFDQRGQPAVAKILLTPEHIKKGRQIERARNHVMLTKFVNVPKRLPERKCVAFVELQLDASSEY